MTDRTSKEQVYVAALRESREYILDNGGERTMAPVIQRIDDALRGTCNRCHGTGIIRDSDTNMGGQCPDCSVETKNESFSVAALRARLADTGMRWSRAHVEGLINQIAELTKQRDEGWDNFYLLRKRVAEQQYPGMTEVVRAHETIGDVRVQNLIRALDAKQAKIDALMMEFCPGEMSKEQREEWAKHQQPVSADLERSITESFARSPRRVESSEKSGGESFLTEAPAGTGPLTDAAKLFPTSASTGGTPPASTSPVECPKCRTQLAFEGDECGLCKEEE